MPLSRADARVMLSGDGYPAVAFADATVACRCMVSGEDFLSGLPFSVCRRPTCLERPAYLERRPALLREV